MAEKRSRGDIDEAAVEKINDQLPELGELRRVSRYLSPDFITFAFAFGEPDSRIPLAAVPIAEAIWTLNQARYALYEALAHRHWYSYQNDQSESKKAVAKAYVRFFLDDAALRLYAAGEHAATSILEMLNIEPDLLAKCKKRGSSRAKTVGSHLINEYPDHTITNAVKELLANYGWEKCINYRNEWVHNQPPLVEGVGSSFKRGTRWCKTSKKGTQALGIGTGDEPDYTIEDLIGFVQPSVNNFAAFMQEVTNFYLQLLEARGLTLTENGPKFEPRS